MILQTVKILVSLATNLTSVRLVLLHVHAVGVWRVGQRVDYTVSAVVVEMQHLVLVAVHPMVLESVLVFVRLVAPNHRALERLVLAPLHHVQMAGRVVDAHFVVLVKRTCGLRRLAAHLHHLRVVLSMGHLAAAHLGPAMPTLWWQRVLLEMRGVVALGHGMMLLLHAWGALMLSGGSSGAAHAHEHVVGRNHLHDVVGVAGHMGLLHGRRWGNVRLLVVPQQVMQRWQRLATAAVVLAVLGLEVGQV